MLTKTQIFLPVCAGSLLFLTACGSAPPIPVDKIASVETLIASARDKEADSHAAVELLKAEQKLAKAKQLIEEKQMEQARLLLEQAMADAKLAESKSDTARAIKVEKETKDSIDTLKKEIERQ